MFKGQCRENWILANEPTNELENKYQPPKEFLVPIYFKWNTKYVD